MAPTLSPQQTRRARWNYNLFNALNSGSYTILNSYILSLYAMRLGASTTFIGLLNAIQFSSYFFMPIGKSLLKRFSIVGVFGWAWIIRYLGMLPCVLAPLLYAARLPGLALALLFASNIVFNIVRGIGTIGNNPVLGLITQGRDRGAYINQISIVNSVVSTVTSLLAALGLGAAASLTRYAVFMGLGIAVGIAGALFLLRMPEPEAEEASSGKDLLQIAREAFADSGFRRFILAFLLASLAAGMSRPFLVVYFKDVYAQGDALIVLFTVIGSIGTLAIGLFSGLIIDRIGAKPLLAFSLTVALASMLPLVLSPALPTGWTLTLFLFAISFALNFGFSGLDSSAQTYFFALIDSKKMLDYAILYFYASGVAGALGSALGGSIVDGLQGLGFGRAGSWRIYFALLSALCIAAIVATARIRQLGSYSVRAAFSVIFSLRDLRAFTLLRELDRSHSPLEDHRLLRSLGESGSIVSEPAIIEHLKSPSLLVRSDALRVLEVYPRLSRRTEEALIAELEQKKYTTAHIAARILGIHKVKAAIPALRAQVSSDDYVLAGESLMALARIGDAGSADLIELMMMETGNPRVMMMGATALRFLGSLSSTPALLRVLGSEAPPLNEAQDEIVLTLATLFHIEESFYPLYADYLAEPERARELLQGISADPALSGALDALYPASGDRTKLPSYLIRTRLPENRAIREACGSDRLLANARFRFFMAALFCSPPRKRHRERTDSATIDEPLS